MKSICCPALFTALLSLSTLAFAQDLPVPAQDSVPSDSNELNEIHPVQAPENSEAQKLIAFFKGLDEAVSAHSGNCQAMSDEISQYYNNHKTWIDSLDYATQNISQADINVIHQLAVDFGKKLAVCHDQKSIPETLKKYAGMSGEF